MKTFRKIGIRLKNLLLCDHIIQIFLQPTLISASPVPSAYFGYQWRYSHPWTDSEHSDLRAFVVMRIAPASGHRDHGRLGAAVNGYGRHHVVGGYG